MAPSSVSQQRRHRLGAGQQAGDVVVRAGGEHRGQHVVAGALGAKLHAQTFGEEVQDLLRRHRMHAAVMPGLAGQCDQRQQVQPQPVLADDADDAERGAAQRVGIAGAGRPLADREEADQQIQLVGQRDGDRDVGGGNRVGRALAARSGRGWRRPPARSSPSCSA